MGEAANEAAPRGKSPASGPADGAAGDRNAVDRSTRRSAVEEGDAMSYRDSGSDSTIGYELAQARIAAGLELDDVAAQLRIRRDFLAALEEGRPDALPGITYAIGYVRTYAAFLGLDVEQAVTRFKQEAAGLDKRTELVFPSPAPEGRVPGLGLMFASVLLAGVAYGGWYWMSERGMSVYDMVPDVPERLAMLIEGQGAAPSVPVPNVPAPSVPVVVAEPKMPAPAVTPESAYRAANPTSVPVTARATDSAGPVPPVAEDSAPPAPDTVTATAGAADGMPVAAAVEDTPPPEPESPATQTSTEQTSTTQTAAAQTTTATAPAAPEPTETQASADAGATSEPVADTVPSAPRLSGLIGASEAAVHDAGADRTPAPIERIIVRATGESWVQVRDEDGTTLFTRVLRSGDVYRVPDRSGLTLATGNAGALEIVVDGKPTPSLGTFGEVVRNIVLDPGRLASGTAISGRN